MIFGKIWNVNDFHVRGWACTIKVQVSKQIAGCRLVICGYIKTEALACCCREEKTKKKLDNIKAKMTC